MKVALPATLLLVTVFFAHGQGELTQEFKMRRKHKAAAEQSDSSRLRKGATPDGSNVAATRLSLDEMAKVAGSMKSKLQQEKIGQVKLKDIQKERMQKFIARYEELVAKGGDASELHPSSMNDPMNAEKIKWYTKNRHREEFKETRGLVLGKTREEREDVAEHLRKEIANHESGAAVMDVQLYEFKKNALLRYDRANHPELVKIKRTEGVESEIEPTNALRKSDVEESSEETDDDAENADEAIVSDGKTAEADDPETLEAPPRSNVDSSSESDDKPPSGVIIHGEEVKRRDANEAPKTMEEKENYRETQAGKKVSKSLHDGEDMSD